MHRAPTRFGEYLRARRAALQPEDIALSREPGWRVAGLRRDEVAHRAGISQEYYLRLEQGRAQQPSPQVVAALGKALLLDADAAIYLEELAGGFLRSHPDTPITIDPSTIALVDGIEGAGAVLADRHLDIAAVNTIARNLLPGLGESGANLAVQVLSHHLPTAEDGASSVHLLAILRYLADPLSERLQEVVANLARIDPGVTALWKRYDVRRPHPFALPFRVASLGPVNTVCQIFFVPTSPQIMITLTPKHSRDRAAFEYLHALA